jgi:hypothetical protein
MDDATLPCTAQSPRLITIDFTAGTASWRTLPIGAGESNSFSHYQMALDPSTHMAAIATSCLLSSSNNGGTFRSELTLLDLTTGTTSRVFSHVLGMEQYYHGLTFMQGGESSVIGIDPVNHVVLQRSLFCPQLIGTFDLNARACLNVYDERGGLVKTIRGLFPDGFADPAPQFNGVNGSTRTGVAMGQQQLGNFIFSFGIQSYSY